MKTNLSVPVILLAKINSLLTQEQLLSFQTKLNVVMVSLILMLSITFSYAQNPGSIQKLDLNKFSLQMDQVINKQLENSKIPGAVFVVVSNSGILYKQAYGIENIETQIPVAIDKTIFRIGSITKVVTFMALMQLYDAGRIDLDNPISSYIKWPILPKELKVKHLLNHTAGFDQIGLHRQVDDPVDRPSIEEFLKTELKLVRSPGAIGTYDTYGATLAGFLIESVSGLTYKEYVEKKVFAPLGMKHSFVEVSGHNRERLAMGYGLIGTKYSAQPYEWYVTLPASSIDATAEDMGKFMTALLSDGSNEYGRLFSKEANQLVKSHQNEYGEKVNGFSYGFWQNNMHGERVLQHGGMMRGYESELFMLPDAELGFYISYNRDGETGPMPGLRDEVKKAFMDYFFTDKVTLIDKPKVEFSTNHLSGIYVANLSCFTCNYGEGWQPSAMRIKSGPPGVVILRNSNWYALSESTFQKDGSSSIIGFKTSGDDGTTYLMQDGYSYTKLTEKVLDNVFGTGWQDRTPTGLEALMYRGTDRTKEAVAAYNEIGQKNNNGRAYYYAGYYALTGDLPDLAITAFLKAIELNQWVGPSSYYLASSYALQGDESQAIDYLKKAAKTGFDISGGVNNDSWWSKLRQNLKVKELLADPSKLKEEAYKAFEKDPPTFDPIGKYELKGEVNFNGEVKEVILKLTIDGLDSQHKGTFSFSILGNAEHKINRIMVSGNQIWIVAEADGFITDIKISIDGHKIEGSMSTPGDDIILTGSKI